jgi:hypothetical protein
MTSNNPPAEPTRPLNVVLTKNIVSIQAGKCYLGMGQAIVVDDVDYIIVANTKGDLDKLATKLRGEDFKLPSQKYHPVAVIHEAAVTLEDDEL